MCGIIAVLPRRPRRRAPTLEEVRAGLGSALGERPEAGDADLAARLRESTLAFERVGALLSGPPGVAFLLAHGEDARQLARDLTAYQSWLDELEDRLDQSAQGLGSLEEINAGLVRLRDAHWALSRDRLRTAAAVGELAGALRGEAAIGAFTAIQTALAALDRVEVRGRDSAGLHVLVKGHGRRRSV